MIYMWILLVNEQTQSADVSGAVIRKVHMYVKLRLRVLRMQLQWNLGIRDTQGTVRNCPEF